jgi:preprotein translocase subunit SecA
MKAKRFNKLLKKIRNLESTVQELSDEELRNKTFEFKERYQNGESLDSLLCEAFAVCIEADYRVLGKKPYDVQVLGGIGLHKGLLIEMNTGEGKTLTATMPLYLNALSGKTSILVTANGYLAYRDAEEMGEVYKFLGLTCRAGVSEKEDKQLKNEEKKEIYSADIVYTTHGTLGFDYLFNNLVNKKEDRFLCDFNYVIIDEADLVLLDSAQMPLVISGAPRVQSNLYEIADFFVRTLKEDIDYEIEDKQIWLTKNGVKYAEKFFGIEHYYSAKNFELNRHVTLTLRAHYIMEKGKDYIVSEKNEIVLMDNGSGRSAPGMKLRGGQHQAIEMKEKISVSQENRSVASITYQNFFLMFPKLSGMSGTIADAKRELKKVYKKDVMIIPPNKKLQRVDKKDLYFKDGESQHKAALEDILRRHETGQPVLIVTSTIEDTEAISEELVKHKISHNVLNANNAYWEAQIIKEAGQKYAVTVSTGMAGRGTDIRLGKGVESLGGLAIIGIGRMDNVRLERQVRGRAGRQGDPGVSQFYVSLEDAVVSNSLGEDKIDKLLNKKHIRKHRLKRLIDGSRKLNEDNGFSSRKQAIEYDKVMKSQRNIFYESRNRLLDGGTLDVKVLRKIIKQNISKFIKESKKLNKQSINRYILDNISYSLDYDTSSLKFFTKHKAKKVLVNYAMELVDERIESLSKEDFDEFVRLCTLHAMDDAWVEEVDYLQQLQYVMSGRQTAQRNPIYEYQKEAYDAFMQMQSCVKKDLMRNFLLGEPQTGEKGEMLIMFP